MNEVYITLEELQALAAAIPDRLPKSTLVRIELRDQHAALKDADDVLVVRVRRPLSWPPGSLLAEATTLNSKP